MRKPNESDRQRIARMVKRCFKPVQWRVNTFNFNGEFAKTTAGETRFYEEGDIDKGVKRLNRLQRVLTASRKAPDAARKGGE